MTDPRQVLVIDDEPDRLHQLAEELQLQLKDVPVEKWQPKPGEDPVKTFSRHLEQPTGLIVTDHDLTKGVIGLLGSTITAWSQERFIPVCNFSRKPLRNLPWESNFFELRVPSEPNETERAGFIARVYEGFQALHNSIRLQGGAARSAPALLAAAMGHPDLEDELAPYITSVGSASSSFLQNLTEANEVPTGDARVDFNTFILGHVLMNAILKFPGPILSRQTLAAYCAFGDSVVDELASLFSNAAYTGPFSAPATHFLRDAVDERIDQLAAGMPELSGNDQVFETDEYNHVVVEHALGKTSRHGCERCDGTRGGFWCPFTQRPVCNREDCSVSSATWIPRGATLCRVERDYYDEWAPLLGE